MMIQVLVCHADGTQELVEREIPDSYLNPADSAEAPPQSME